MKQKAANNSQVKLPLSESELLEGLNEYTGRADLLPIYAEDEFFESPLIC